MSSIDNLSKMQQLAEAAKMKKNAAETTGNQAEKEAKESKEQERSRLEEELNKLDQNIKEAEFNLDEAEKLLKSDDFDAETKKSMKNELRQMGDEVNALYNEHAQLRIRKRKLDEKMAEEKKTAAEPIERIADRDEVHDSLSAEKKQKISDEALKILTEKGPLEFLVGISNNESMLENTEDDEPAKKTELSKKISIKKNILDEKKADPDFKKKLEGDVDSLNFGINNINADIKYRQALIEKARQFGDDFSKVEQFANDNFDKYSKSRQVQSMWELIEKSKKKSNSNDCANIVELMINELNGEIESKSATLRKYKFRKELGEKALAEAE